MASYEIYRGGLLLGTIEHTEDDFPWHLGTFRPGPGFDAAESLFELEATLLSGAPGGWDERAWRRVRDEIDAPGVRLVETDTGRSVERPLLHIQLRQAWWR